jgi:hypothetical protein
MDYTVSIGADGKGEDGTIDRDRPRVLELYH